MTIVNESSICFSQLCRPIMQDSIVEIARRHGKLARREKRKQMKPSVDKLVAICLKGDCLCWRRPDYNQISVCCRQTGEGAQCSKHLITTNVFSVKNEILISNKLHGLSFERKWWGIYTFDNNQYFAFRLPCNGMEIVPP